MATVLREAADEADSAPLRSPCPLPPCGLGGAVRSVLRAGVLAALTQMQGHVAVPPPVQTLHVQPGLPPRLDSLRGPVSLLNAPVTVVLDTPDGPVFVEVEFRGQHGQRVTGVRVGRRLFRVTDTVPDDDRTAAMEKVQDVRWHRSLELCAAMGTVCIDRAEFLRLVSVLRGLPPGSVHVESVAYAHTGVVAVLLGAPGPMPVTFEEVATPPVDVAIASQ